MDTCEGMQHIQLTVAILLAGTAGLNRADVRCHATVPAVDYHLEALH